MNSYIECPYCNYKHENWHEYIDNEDMEGEFSMDCEKCEKGFCVKFNTIIEFKTTK